MKYNYGYVNIINIYDYIHLSIPQIFYPTFSYFRPYSPDLNPIEEAFGCAKQWLKRNQDICIKYPKWCFEIALQQVYSVKIQIGLTGLILI